MTNKLHPKGRWFDKITCLGGRGQEKYLKIMKGKFGTTKCGCFFTEITMKSECGNILWKAIYLSDCLIKSPKLSGMQFHSLNKELQGNNYDFRKSIFLDEAKCGPIDFENINLLAIICSKYYLLYFYLALISQAF